MKIKGSFDLIAYIPTASTLERSRGLSSVAVAETALIDARDILAKNSRHPWASPSQKEAAKNNFIRKREEYLTAIVEHNERCKKKNLTHYLFTPKQSLLHDPSELALERMNYGVRHPTSKGGIPFMHRVDQPFDPKAISGKDLWLDEAVAWATQDAYYAHKDMIEIRLKEGKPLEQEEVKQIISARDEKLYKDFYITPDTQMMAASRIELMNMMLENTEYLLFTSLCQSIAPGFVSLEAKNINEAFQKNGGFVESKLTKKILDFAKLKSALVNLDPSFSTMKFDNNSQVILNKLLEILGRSGPDERKVMEFVSQIVPAAQHKEFSNLIRSLHNLYKSREQMNLHIDKINQDLANQTGKAGEAQRAVNRENGAKLWNKRTKKLPQGSEKVAYGVVAAGRTAELLLDENFDPNHADALKGKISEPVQEALGSGADSKFAEAAEQGAIDGVEYAKSHAADLDIIVGLSSVAVFESIFSSKDVEASKFEESKSGQQLKKSIRVNLEKIPSAQAYIVDAYQFACGIARNIKTHIEKEEKESVLIKERLIALTVYLNLRHSHIKDETAKTIARFVMNQYIAEKKIPETEGIEKIIEEKIGDDSEKRTLLALSSKIYNSVYSSLAISNGLIGSASALTELVTKTDLEAVFKDVFIGDLENYREEFIKFLLNDIKTDLKSIDVGELKKIIERRETVFNVVDVPKNGKEIKLDDRVLGQLANDIYARISANAAIKGLDSANSILQLSQDTLSRIKDIIEKNPHDREKVIKEIAPYFLERGFSTYAALAFVLGNNITLVDGKLSIKKIDIATTIRSEAAQLQPRLIMATSAAIGSAVANMVPDKKPELANSVKNYFLNNHDKPFDLNALWNEIKELKPVPDANKIKEELCHRVYDAYVITTATKAMKEAEKIVSQEFKDPKTEEKRPRYREVAAAVTAAALASGCTQTQALELSKELTTHYLNHGNFNTLKYTDMVKNLFSVPANFNELTRLLSRAAPAAAALTKEDDPMRAGTLLAAEVFKFMTPAHASSMAASVTMASSVAKTRKVDATAMANSAIYAAGICKKIDSSLVAGAATLLASKYNFDVPDKDSFKNQMKDEIGLIRYGLAWKDLSSEQQTKVNNITDDILTVADSLPAKLNVTDDAVKQSMLSEGLAIIANTMIIGDKLGLTRDNAERLAKNLTNKSTLERMRDKDIKGHQSEPIVTTNVVLASQCVDDCWAAINMDNRGAGLLETEIKYDISLGDAITEDMVARKAREEYYRVKRASGYQYGNAKERAAAEILGKQAAMRVYLDALQNHKFTTEEAFRAIVVHAINDSEKAIQALDEYRNSMPASSLTVRPATVDPKLVKKIVNSNIAVVLVHKGMNASKEKKGVFPQVLSAIQGIIKGANLGIEYNDKNEKIQEIIISNASPTQKGVLIAELIKPVSREVSEAIATVVTSLTGDNDDLEPTGKTKEIIKAGAIARVREEGVLPSMSEHEPNKIPKMLAEIAPDELLRLRRQKMEHFKELAKERNSITGDFMGVSEEVSKIQYCTINTKDVSTWSFHFDGDEPNEHHGLEDLSDFKDLIPQLQDLDGHLTVAHFEKAIENFNKNHRNEHKIMNFLRTSVGMKLLPPTDLISKDALTHRKDGSLKLSTKGLSRGQLKEIFKEVIQLAKEDKTYKTAKMAGKDTVMKIPAANIMA